MYTTNWAINIFENLDSTFINRPTDKARRNEFYII